MRILHTSDWHLGKKLESLSRLSEQQAVLNGMVQLVDKENVELVLISGDIFDTFVPSSEAEALFYDTMYKLTNLGVAVAIISGNHDDPLRLAASKQLTKLNGVFFSGSNEEYTTSKFGRISLVAGGSDYLIFKNEGGESVYVAMLPYPTEYRMKENAVEGETFDQKVKRYLDAATCKNVDNLPLVVMAHIFMLGGERSESERQIELGGTRILDKSILPINASYVALGHLHKRQIIDKDRNILYSGSLLQYSFDESKYKKSVTIFDLVGDRVENLREVELENYIKLERLSADGFENALQLLENHKDNIVELKINLDTPPTSDQIKLIATKYPLCFAKYSYSIGEKSQKTRALMSNEELFIEFYKQTYGSEPKQELLDLFLNYMNKIEVEDET